MPCIGSNLQLMLECMTRKCCMIHFNIYFEIFIKSILFQKTD